MAGGSQGKAAVWGGWAASVLPSLLLAASAVMKLSHGAPVVASFTGQFGYRESSLVPIAVVELLCTALYLLPRTQVLGAVLLTGYLGGAVATHARVGDNFVPPIVLGVLLWAGLWLRDGRLRELLPLKK
jgi:DoxX-like family